MTRCFAKTIIVLQVFARKNNIIQDIVYNINVAMTSAPSKKRKDLLFAVLTIVKAVVVLLRNITIAAIALRISALIPIARTQNNIIMMLRTLIIVLLTIATDVQKTVSKVVYIALSTNAP